MIFAGRSACYLHVIKARSQLFFAIRIAVAEITIKTIIGTLLKASP